MILQTGTFQTGVRCRFFFLFCAISLSFFGCEPSRSALLADAESHLRSNDPDAARRDYQKILERHPFDIPALEGMMEVTRSNERSAEYLDYCRRLLRLRPWDRRANLAVGKDLLDKENLKDAAVRFYLAFLDSDFVQDKNEALSLLEQTRIKEQQRIQQMQESQNEPSKRTDTPS